MKLQINHLSHQYDHTEVLKSLNLSIEGYRAVAILGISGSGKSTLLRMLAGLETPTQGSIEVNGRNVCQPSHRQSIGFVFQHHNLFPHLSLLRNITLILEKTRGHSPESAEKIATHYLSLLQLTDQMHKLPKQVSGGQAQRASIARALSLQPDLVLLDEPTSALDPILTHEVLMAIKKLESLGQTLILVSHVISFVRQSADYILFLHSGELVEHGSPTILDAPATAALSAFMEKVH